VDLELIAKTKRIFSADLKKREHMHKAPSRAQRSIEPLPADAPEIRIVHTCLATRAHRAYPEWPQAVPSAAHALRG
jgi:hypothetical protein